MFVQLVIAAITTDPCFTSGDGADTGANPMLVSPSSTGPPVFFFGFFKLGSASSNDFRAWNKLTRPAGASVRRRSARRSPRSRSQTLLYTASAVVGP